MAIGVEIPFYWAIAPDYDATFNPRITTQQGVLLQAEFRQRLMDGSYQIRAYGIDQLDPGAFAGQPGDRQFRGGARDQGRSSRSTTNGSGAGKASCSPTTCCCRITGSRQYKDPFSSFLTLPTEATPRSSI